MWKTLKYVILIIGAAFYIAAYSTACGGENPSSIDSEMDAQVKDGELRDVDIPDAEPADAQPPDAEIDPTWCQDPDNPLVFPGTDPNGVKIPGTGEGRFTSASWSENYVVFSESSDSSISVVNIFDLDLWTKIFSTSPEHFATSVTIDKNEVLWSDSRYPGDEGPQTDIIHYDISTGIETRWTDTPDLVEFPVILKEDYLLYNTIPVEGPTLRKIYLVELSTWDSTLIATSEVGRGAEGFDMSDKYISWVAHPYYMAPNRHVYYYNIETGETSFLETTGPGLGYGTGVDGERIVWEDRRNGNWDIYMYDIQTGEETLLTPNPYDQKHPRITGNNVVFQDYRYTKGHYGGCFCHLSILDVSTMTLRRITSNPLFWRSGARRIINRNLLAIQVEEHRVYSLWLFDLVEMGILDSTGKHVIPKDD